MFVSDKAVKQIQDLAVQYAAAEADLLKAIVRGRADKTVREAQERLSYAVEQMVLEVLVELRR